MVNRICGNAHPARTRRSLGRLSRTVSALAAGALALGLSVSGAEPVGSGETVRPVTARDLVGSKGMSGLIVSPDGRFAVVRVDGRDITRDATDLNWYRVRLSDGQATWIGNAGEPLWSVNGALDTVAPQWSQDGQWIYYRRIQDQQSQVWRLKVDGSEHEPVTALEADVHGFILNPDNSLIVATDPATRAEILAAERAAYDNGVLMDKTIIPGFPLFESFPVNGRMAALRANLPTINRNWGRATLLGNQPLKVVKREASGTSFVEASAEEADRFSTWWESGGYDHYEPDWLPNLEARRGARSATLDFLAANPPEGSPASRSRFYLQVRDANAARKVCASPTCLEAAGLSLIGWSPDGSEVIFQTYNAGAETLHAWNIESNTIRAIFNSGGMLGSHLSGTSGPCRLIAKAGAGQRAICIFSAAATPPRLISVDLSTGHSTELFNPNPSLTSARLGSPERIVLTDRWGGTTTAVLLLPHAWLALAPGQRPKLPLVISSYTCSGFLKGGSGEDVPEHVLAGKGYAAVCADLSGSSIRPGAGFDRNADHTVHYKQEQDFFEDVIDQLSRRGIVDERRVAASGFSGSAAGLAYTLHNSAKFTAAILTTESFLDPINCYLAGNYGTCRENQERRGYELPYDAREGYYHDISPAWNAGKITTPILMQLPVVEYAAMMQLHTALGDYDRAVDMYIFADEYHIKRHPRHLLAVYERNIAWVDFWLKGEEPLDRADDELPRWREFRKKQCALFKSGQGNMQQPWYCAT